MDYLSYVVPFDGVFDVLLLVFGVFALVTLLYVALSSRVARYALESVRCPRDGRPAMLVFRRRKAGRRGELVSCSVGGKARDLDCGYECLGPGGSRQKTA